MTTTKHIKNEVKSNNNNNDREINNDNDKTHKKKITIQKCSKNNSDKNQYKNSGSGNKQEQIECFGSVVSPYEF